MKKTSGIRYKGNGTYYESHHIIPHSLGGSDDNKNLVLLTAREHYLCHWLLVKRNNVGSVARKKMIKAWFMMSANGNNLHRPSRNMKTYAKYRNEMSSVMHDAQSGKKNSQYGKHWYTNRDTGECNSFLTAPNDKWIKGRFLFRGENSFIKAYVTKIKKQNKIIKKKKEKKEVIKFEYINIFVKTKNRIVKKLKYKYEKSIMETQKIWDDYHNGNYKCLRDYAKFLNLSVVAIRGRFLNYIPLYEKIIKPCKCFPSNKDLIGKYE